MTKTKTKTTHLNANRGSSNSISIDNGEKSILDTIDINTTPDLIDDLDGLSDDDIAAKSTLSDKEKTFLTIYFNTNNVSQAVKMAGYKAKSQQAQSLIKNRILHKYCAAMDDKRQILRELGWSEVALAMHIAQLATNARSETVRLNALKTLATIHGLLRDADEMPPSVPIKFVFEGEGGEGEAQPEDSRRNPHHDKPPTKPVSIVQ